MTTDTGYTNRAWREEMYYLVHDGLTTMLGGALEHMHAGLVSVGAADPHLKFSQQCQTLVRDLAARGAGILGDWQPKAVRMGDAVTAAGGMAAEDKEYHQR
jgi:hypothetical protein